MRIGESIDQIISALQYTSTSQRKVIFSAVKDALNLEYLTIEPLNKKERKAVQ